MAGLRADGLRWIERVKTAGEVAGHVDEELLLDLVTGSVYYRLLWRGEALTEAEVAPLVDLVLAGAAQGNPKSSTCSATLIECSE